MGRSRARNVVESILKNEYDGSDGLIFFGNAQNDDKLDKERIYPQNSRFV
jgi:hypothetical protein